jgi:dihydrofolate reductase
MNRPRVSMIAAMSQNYVIGKNNKLPWHIPEDMKHFRDITRGHAVIMGRKTYESMGKPLPNRINIVISRNTNYSTEGCVVVQSLEKAIEEAKRSEAEEIFIIGGAEIYQLGLEIADRIYLTIIHQNFDGDTFFPKHPQFTKEIERTKYNNSEYEFEFLILEK